MLGGFLSVSLLLGIISFISYYNIKKVDESYSDLVERRVIILSNAKDMQISASRQISGMRGVLMQEEGSSEIVATAINDLSEKINATIQIVQREELKAKLQKLQILNADFKSQSDAIIASARSNPEQAVRQSNQVLFPLAREIRDMSDQIANEQAKLMEEASAANRQLVDSVVTTVLFLSVFACILAVLIGVYITRIIKKNLF